MKAVVRPARFELATFWFVAKRSIQLSYGRARGEVYSLQSAVRSSFSVQEFNGSAVNVKRQLQTANFTRPRVDNWCARRVLTPLPQPGALSN